MRRRTMGGLVVLAVLVGTLAGCTEEFQKGKGECVPGVGDTSQIHSTVPRANC